MTMAEAAHRAAHTPGIGPINLYKNNTDNKGASYGAHENYLMSRQTPFADIVAHFTPFLVTRQVFCGAGRIGIGQDASESGFQVSQRADFFEVEVGLETTLKRPIINTRDEPHADAERYRRLHVIIGDANLAEYATFLKVGTASIVLAMVEAGAFDGSLAVAEPVAELRAVSHDPSLAHKIELRSGKRMTAVELQQSILEDAERFCGADADPATREVLDQWAFVLDALARDPMELADMLDWPAKLSLLNRYRDREDLDWGSHKLQAIDLQYHDVRPEKGLYHRLVKRGSMKRLLTDAEVMDAMIEPPEDTRAFFRGRCLARYPSEVVAASWDSVIFDVGADSLVRVPMMEPERGTKAHVGELFDRCEAAKDLLDVITAE
ncbi:depupylase/deamidase Dop [Glycomyces albus]